MESRSRSPGQGQSEEGVFEEVGCIVRYDLYAWRIALMGKKKDEGGVEKGRHPIVKVSDTREQYT